jgi:hypothetical protein
VCMCVCVCFFRSTPWPGRAKRREVTSATVMVFESKYYCVSGRVQGKEVTSVIFESNGHC